MNNQGQADISLYRGALFQDRNGRDQAVLDFFSHFFEANKQVFQAGYYQSSLDRINNYQARTFNLDAFYKAFEFNQIVQHQF